jgi:ubiquitin-protein ligase E3 C
VGMVEIRRGQEFQSAYQQIGNKNLRKPFKIVFVNQFGMKELGVDAGGLKKEFLNRVLK